MQQSKYEEVITANISLHSKMADDYSTCEPHFRPENVEKVERKLSTLFREVNARKLLDLGCGTGFIINIAKKYVQHIDGVDVTQAMLHKVDLSGNAVINLHNSDTGSFPAVPGTYDIVTGYSFLHHLYDIKPTLKTAFTALKDGGKLYCDLDPNYYYWESIHQLDRNGSYDTIVKREIEMVTYKDEDIEKNFGVSKDTFNNAEFGKNIAGGFKEENLIADLKAAGFREVQILYYWFLGQASLINDTWGTKEERIKYADVMDSVLQRSLPVSRNLYKYMGFVATK
ncbi:MAG: class I SAM-dependent methyltransferase [Chitinophagaceae bacterium]|nr:class I SAM-dependent methyltransferase [Chitinophagaceae bacterium]